LEKFGDAGATFGFFLLAFLLIGPLISWWLEKIDGEKNEQS
jgi:uncharacterized Tic20 family protein